MRSNFASAVGVRTRRYTREDGLRGLFGRRADLVSGDGADLRPAAPPLEVLVVDDNRDCADSTLELLGLWGHDGRAVYSGADALVAVERFRPDVFLLDIGLPRMSGYELARCLRPRFPTALLVAITGHAHGGYRKLCREAGFDLYLTKPVTLPDLQAVLRHEQRKRAAIGWTRHDDCSSI